MFVASFNPTEDMFKTNTAKGNLCGCTTDTCNNVTLESFKNNVIKKNNNPMTRGIKEKDTSVIDDVTYSLMSYTSSTPQVVSIDDVTDYWMNYTGVRSTPPQNTQVTDSNDQTGVSTADNPTTHGLAAEQVKYNELLIINITIMCLLVW